MKSILTAPAIRNRSLDVTAVATQQIRHATSLRRPKRPYTFTQLVTLSDGSTFTHRTTSPQPIYRTTKDTKNTLLWNPSSSKLTNIEEDEAGRLKKFRARFGRGFDAEAKEIVVDPENPEDANAKEKAVEEESNESLMDLISEFATPHKGPSSLGSSKKNKKK